MKTEMTYNQKKAIADAYLTKKCGMTWDLLADVNSLHNAETKADIIAMCKERLSEEGFPGM